MRRSFIATMTALALAASATSGHAADLLPMATKAPPAPPPLFSWTGFYLGVNGGGAWGRSFWDTAGGLDTSGGLVGGTIGYNFQFGQSVLGFEGDIDWASIRGSATTAGCPAGCSTSDSWLSTARGRLGYAFDRVLPYVTGGAAFGDIQASSAFGSASATNVGWTVGGGLEFALPQRWSLKVEYLYVDLGHFDCGLSCGAVAPDNVSFRTNLVRAGINYRF